MKKLFSEDDHKRIQDAISKAEDRTSGEIVPYIVGHSDRYEAAIWRGAGLMVLLALMVSMLVYQFYEGWKLARLYTGWGAALLVVISGLVGTLLTAFVPALKRMFAGEEMLAERVHDRAMRAFVEEEVFNTRDRTGILLFISVLEHRIEVMGDEGINNKVTPDDWVAIVDKMREDIKQGQLAQGLIDAIEMCGELLERKGVDIKPDDTDELPNTVRIRDE